MTENIQYKVLARKYRPSTFDDLIGQEALVKTLANAIESGRIAQAYMLTGIRGIGKTTSARIIAKALNCTGKDGKGGMTPNPCGECENCRAIAEDRHVDVQEIDAASNTQVDNIREIIQSARYNPVSARYKVYIIDEVHMLSKGASNALLKLLEEPPERVKFIFATTEIRKVPVTILSRCQRFDLRRVEADVIADYFKKIVKKEKVEAADEAIDIIAKCADGSVRDGLSLLDQAIAHSGGKVSAEMVRAMLGLADKTALFDLFERLMQGKTSEVLRIVSDMKASGADALMILQDLADLVYLLTKLKIEPNLKLDATVSELEAKRGRELSAKLSMAVLTRCWQMILKGIGEVKDSSASFVALEMVLVRIAYAYGVATPMDIMKELKGQKDKPLSENVMAETVSEIVPSQVQVKAAIQDSAGNKPLLRSLNDVAALARKNGQSLLALNVEKYMHPVEFNGDNVKVRLEAGYPHDLIVELTKKLKEWTGKEFTIVAVEEGGGNTIKQDKEKKAEELKIEMQKDELVKATLEAFPDAKVQEARPVNLFGDFDENGDDNDVTDNNGEYE